MLLLNFHFFIAEEGNLLQYSVSHDEWNLVCEGERSRDNSLVKKLCVTSDRSFCFFPMRQQIIRVDLLNQQHPVAILKGHMDSVNCIEINNSEQVLFFNDFAQ